MPRKNRILVLEAILPYLAILDSNWKNFQIYMSKPRKCKIDFNYSIYSKTGVKVPIERAAPSNMDDQKQLEEKKLLELQIFDDIQDIYDTHALDGVDGLEELEEVLEEISLLTRKFRHIHAELGFVWVRVMLPLTHSLINVSRD